MAALLVLQHELKKQNEQLRKDVMALEGEVLGALHHGVEDPSSIWRTTVGEVVAMRDELVLLVQVWELASHRTHVSSSLCGGAYGASVQTTKARARAGMNDGRVFRSPTPDGWRNLVVGLNETLVLI